MAKLKFEPNIEIASSPTPWASGDEHKDATANAGACSQEQSSRPQSGYISIARKWFRRQVVANRETRCVGKYGDPPAEAIASAIAGRTNRLVMVPKISSNFVITDNKKRRGH